jgi:putative membrane protein
MVKRLLARWAILAIAFAVVAQLLSGIHLHGGFPGLLWVSLLFGVVNMILGTLVRIITAPVMLLTLGLFGIVVNALMLGLVAWLSEDLDVDGAGTALGAAVLLSVVSWLLSLTPLGRVKRGKSAKSQRR